MVQLPPLSLALPAIKIAIEQGLLQAQTLKGPVAQYQGPCAIGFVLPPEQQALLDKGSSDGAYSIRSFFRTFEVEAFEGDSQEDWLDLQQAHDRWYSAAMQDTNVEHHRKEFSALVDKLIPKYPVFPSQQ